MNCRLAFNNDSELATHLQKAVESNPQMIMCVIDNNRTDT